MPTLLCLGTHSPKMIKVINCLNAIEKVAVSLKLPEDRLSMLQIDYGQAISVILLEMSLMVNFSMSR